MFKSLLLVAILAISASAGNLFSTISGMTMDEIKPTSYTVDTAGLNPRVYQWTPVGLPNFVCVALFPNADGKSVAAVPAMQCFKGK